MKLKYDLQTPRQKLRNKAGHQRRKLISEGESFALVESQTASVLGAISQDEGGGDFSITMP